MNLFSKYLIFLKKQHICSKEQVKYKLYHCDILPHRLDLEASVFTMETSPSPSSNGANLLSLPWEIVTQIASHLPAQCVINVLPQVITSKFKTHLETKIDFFFSSNCAGCWAYSFLLI